MDFVDLILDFFWFIIISFAHFCKFILKILSSIKLNQSQTPGIFPCVGSVCFGLVGCLSWEKKANYLVMSHSESQTSSGVSAELKLYQAFIFSVPIFFAFILLFVFYLFYLRRRRADWSSLRMRTSPGPHSDLSIVCFLVFFFFFFKKCFFSVNNVC